MLLLVLMVATSVAEMAGVGAVLPFLGVLTSPEHVFGHPLAQPLIHLLDLRKPQDLLFPMTILFGVAVLMAGVMRLLLLWASTRLSFMTGADLSVSIYRRTLYQPYSVHISRNSSEVINGISNKVNNAIHHAIMPAMTIISSVFMMTAILGILLTVNPSMAMTALAGFGSIYLAVIGLTRKRLSKNSREIARESTQVIKALQEGLGGIRDVLIDGTQSLYCRVYRRADLAMRRGQSSNIFIGSSPRYGIEALGMLFIAVLAYSLAQQENGVARAIPMLGFLALAAQRLLPVLQQAYGAWSSIQGGHDSLMDTLQLLEQPLPAHAEQPQAEPLPFRRQISLRNVSFAFGSHLPRVLRDVSLTIPRGSRVGFIGKTGSGKSTLLDIVMGLLQPGHGSLEIDGQVVDDENVRAWQAHIAHVPQAIFLTDGTIESNIAFGVPEEDIDRDRVREAAEKAQIAEMIEGWPEKYRNPVGERGIRLSGGQRQRIGIARALYKNADVLIFDEATSALDGETEEAVMQAIESLGEDLTILIIAHRLTTLRNCTQVVELSDGRVKRIGGYEAVINRERTKVQGDYHA